MIGVYVRVSEKRQTEKYGPEAQRNGGISFAKGLGEDYKIYEEAKTGTTISRIELQYLFDDIANQLIDKVWVIDQDRISRDVEDSSVIRKHFLKHKCKLFVDDSEIDLSDPSSKFMYQVRAAVGELEASQIRRRMARGRKISFDAGRRVKSRLYGYKHEWIEGKRRWWINQEQAKIVKRIFKMWIDGNCITRIKKILNQEAIETYMNLRWNEKELWKILQRIEYIGKTRDSESNIINSKIYKAIINEETFKKANVLVAKYHKSNQEKQFRYAKTELSAIIKCANCGSPYKYREQRRFYKRKDGIRSIYYREIYCHSGVIYDSKCHNRPKMIYRKKIEPIVRAIYRETFLNQELIEKWVKLKRKELENDFKTKNEIGIRIAKRIKDIEKQRDRLVTAVMRGTLPDETVKPQMAILLKQIDENKQLLLTATEGYRKKVQEIEEIESVFVTSNLMDFETSDPFTRRRIYRNVFEECSLDQHMLHIKFIIDKEYDIDLKNLPEWIENSIKMDTEVKEDLARLENQAAKTGVYG